MVDSYQHRQHHHLRMTAVGVGGIARPHGGYGSYHVYTHHPHRDLQYEGRLDGHPLEMARGVFWYCYIAHGNHILGY